MNNINQTKANIKKIETFVKYLNNNFKTHSAILMKRDSNLGDLENSLAFVKDYAEVSEKLMEVINDYCGLNGMGLD